ncbi:hypothetical protein D9M70_510280 [compost metagenome]
MPAAWRSHVHLRTVPAAEGLRRSLPWLHRRSGPGEPEHEAPLPRHRALAARGRAPRAVRQLRPAQDRHPVGNRATGGRARRRPGPHHHPAWGAPGVPPRCRGASGLAGAAALHPQHRGGRRDRGLPHQLRDRARWQAGPTPLRGHQPGRSRRVARLRRQQDLPRVHAAVRRRRSQSRREDRGRPVPVRGHGHPEPERLHRTAGLCRLPGRDGCRRREDPLLQAQQREGRPVDHPPPQGGGVLAMGRQLGPVHPAP